MEHFMTYLECLTHNVQRMNCRPTIRVPTLDKKESIPRFITENTSPSYKVQRFMRLACFINQDCKFAAIEPTHPLVCLISTIADDSSVSSSSKRKHPGLTLGAASPSLALPKARDHHGKQ